MSFHGEALSVYIVDSEACSSKDGDNAKKVVLRFSVVLHIVNNLQDRILR